MIKTMHDLRYLLVIQYLKTRVHVACISNIAQPTGTCNCICWPYSSISTTRFINAWRSVMDKNVIVSDIYFALLTVFQYWVVNTKNITIINLICKHSFYQRKRFVFSVSNSMSSPRKAFGKFISISWGEIIESYSIKWHWFHFLSCSV